MEDGRSPAKLDEDVDKERFAFPETLEKSQARFVNGYNWVKPHKTLGVLTPWRIDRFFFQDFVNGP